MNIGNGTKMKLKRIETYFKKHLFETIEMTTK